MKLRIYQIDAFTDRVFGGNYAAVVPLPAWLSDELMQNIAAENNLPETAFFVPQGDVFEIRWFTPVHEAAFCGHATLASAFVLFELEPKRQQVQFETRHVGPLWVKRATRLEMDLPAIPLEIVNDPPIELLEGLGVRPTLLFKNFENYFAVLENEAAVRAVRPDFAQLERLHPFGVVVTAPGEQTDCTSRYFVPGAGIPEDPVTGSIHASLAVYWAARLGKETLHAYQASHRGGHLYLELRGDRVIVSGHAVKYLEGVIHV
jgi:predicted PhzF superfamily epimerase YddE/YHI9